jgi:DNA-binding CsgD family transcriptional regulator
MIRPKNPINSATIEACPLLSNRDKEILQLRIIGEKSGEEIAQNFGITAQTISGQLRNAVNKYDKWASLEGKNIVADLFKSSGRLPKTPQSIISKETRNLLKEGELAAKAFTLFKNGSNPIDVTIQLKQSPTIINKLYTEYLGIPPNTPLKEYSKIINQIDEVNNKINDINFLLLGGLHVFPH